MKYLIINGAGSSIDISNKFPDGRKLLENLKNNYDTGNVIKNHNPSSIDHLMTKIIDQNQHQELVGKVKKAISDIIFEAQNKVPQWNNNYFFDIIQNLIGIDKIDQLDVINFNYDTTLEKVVEYLIGIYKSENDGDEERKKSRIIKLENLGTRLQNSHVYGYIGDNGNNIDFIRVTTNERIEDFITKIKNSENIYFLGFGFDQTNLQNLGFFDNELTSHFISNRRLSNSKKIFVTNYVGEVEVRMSKTNQFVKSTQPIPYVIDKRRFSNKIMLTLEEIFDCKIQIVRDGFFSQGFVYNEHAVWYPTKLYISNLGVGNAVREDFIF